MNKKPKDRSMRVNISIRESQKPILDEVGGSKWIQMTLDNAKYIKRCMRICGVTLPKGKK